MSAYVAAGAGFLLAVLWFDLMFDVQTLGSREHPLPEPVLASVASYYRRVTTTARPMNRLVALAMLATLAAIVAQLAEGDGHGWVAIGSLALTLAAVALAATRTVPQAVRLGARADDPERQSTLARAICREHLLCIAAIALALILQLVFD
jgi:ER membrane protein SH3